MKNEKMDNNRRDLQQTILQNLKKTGKQYFIWDKTLKGFGVRVSQKGAIAYIVVGHTPEGKSVKATVGRYPEMKLADARAEAKTIKLRITDGEYRPKSQVMESTPEEKQTFSAVVDEYIENYAKPKMRPRSVQELSWTLNRKFCLSLGEKDINAVTEQDIQKIIDDLKSKGKNGAANHAVSDIKRFFSWAVDAKQLKESPAAKIKKVSEYIPRSRVVSNSELGLIYLAAEEMSNEGKHYGDIVRLLMLTGARRGQITQLLWENVHLEDRQIFVHSKQRSPGKKLLLPLSPTAFEIMKTIERTTSPYVFPAEGNDKNPFSGFSKGLFELKRRCGTLSEQKQLLWAEDWTPHDFRRSFSTTFARPKLGVPREVTESILDHTLAGGVVAHSQIAAVYNLYEYLDEKVEALNKWEQMIIKFREEAFVMKYGVQNTA
jgi:integrase